MSIADSAKIECSCCISPVSNAFPILQGMLRIEIIALHCRPKIRNARDQDGTRVDAKEIHLLYEQKAARSR